MQMSGFPVVPRQGIAWARFPLLWAWPPTARARRPVRWHSARSEKNKKQKKKTFHNKRPGAPGSKFGQEDGALIDACAGSLPAPPLSFPAVLTYADNHHT